MLILRKSVKHCTCRPITETSDLSLTGFNVFQDDMLARNLVWVLIDNVQEQIGGTSAVWLSLFPFERTASWSSLNRLVKPHCCTQSGREVARLNLYLTSHKLYYAGSRWRLTCPVTCLQLSSLLNKFVASDLISVFATCRFLYEAKRTERACVCVCIA
jgi:hypothetical protein